MLNMDIGEQLFLLSRGLSWNILTYQGYEINGNTFYTDVSQVFYVKDMSSKPKKGINK